MLEKRGPSLVPPSGPRLDRSSSQLAFLPPEDGLLPSEFSPKAVLWAERALQTEARGMAAPLGPAAHARSSRSTQTRRKGRSVFILQGPV